MRLLHAQSRAGRADAVSTLGDVLLNPVSFFQGVTAFDERRTHRLNDDFNLLVAYCPVPDLRRPGLRFRRRMVRKPDLHEDAMVRYRGSAVAIMGFEYAESDRPVPVYADRCFRLDEPPPT